MGSAGDVNGDGYPEVIVGATVLSGCGRAFVYSSVLSNFRVTSGEPARVEWHLSTGTDYQGYNLYRATSEERAYAKINTQLIAGLGEHMYEDEAVISDLTYYYKLGALHRKGHEIIFGPISATAETTMP